MVYAANDLTKKTVVDVCYSLVDHVNCCQRMDVSFAEGWEESDSNIDGVATVMTALKTYINPNTS